MYAERIVFVRIVVCHTCKCPFCIRKCMETLFNWLNSIDVSWEFGICWQVIDWLVLNNFLVYSKCAMRIYFFDELYWRSDYSRHDIVDWKFSLPKINNATKNKKISIELIIISIFVSSVVFFIRCSYSYVVLSSSLLWYQYYWTLNAFENFE